MDPDEVMLKRRPAPERRELTPEEAEALAPRRAGFRLPDPMSYVAFREMKGRKTAVEIGLKGTF